MAEISKGFIKDWSGNNLLPITRGELVLDQDGNIALNSKYFLAGENGTQYGLITAAERALLAGGTGGSGGSGSIGDLANKLNYINQGLKFNNNTLNFYTTEGVATPINIIAASGLVLGVQQNNVLLGMAQLYTEDKLIEQVVKKISVDQYGRVTDISGGLVESQDIAQVLTQKVLNNSILDACVTSVTDIGTNDCAVANKAYVDQKVREIGGVATGSLRFNGSISTTEEASGLLQSAINANTYYKIISNNVELDKSLFYESNAETGTVKAKIGDTLIVCHSSSANALRFVYIPSGDDITTITVKEEGKSAVLNNRVGNVGLQFSSLFSVSVLAEGSGTATISIPKANASQDGYLSAGDWSMFKSYETKYENKLAQTVGLYEIGTLTIGQNSHTIYGINSVSELSLGDGAQSSLNPVLTFKETGQNDVNIILQGYQGINVVKNENSVQFGINIENDSTNYLSITDQQQLKVQIGSFDNTSQTITNGLVDFNTFYTQLLLTSQTNIFESIDYSLKGSESNSEYRYGNEKLKNAVNVDI